MWKHEILKDNEKTWRTPAANRTMMLAVHTMLKESTSFYFGEYANALSIEKNLRGKTITMPPPPFASTLIEYRFEELSQKEPSRGTTKEQTEISSRRAILYNEVPGIARMVVSFCYMDRLNLWVLHPLYFIDYQKNREKSGIYCLWSDPNLVSLVSNKSSCKDIKDELDNMAVLLTLLNTRNIVTKLVTPPDRLNKARIKRKQEPLDKYYILEVAKGVPKTKYQGEVPWDYQPPAERALHLCRGHFKTYTEDAPLLGKHTGTFWWQPSVRGKKENGTITKDYAITMGA